MQSLQVLHQVCYAVPNALRQDHLLASAIHPATLTVSKHLGEEIELSLMLSPFGLQCNSQTDRASLSPLPPGQHNDTAADWTACALLPLHAQFSAFFTLHALKVVGM